MPRFRRHNMAEVLVSSPAFCELVDLGPVKVWVKLRTLRITVLTMLLAMSVILKSLDPLRSLKRPGLASLSSFGKDQPLMSLRASGLLRPLMRPGRSELRSSNWSLRSLALMRSLEILISFLFLSWLELPVFSSLFSFREDSVNNGRSNDGVSPVRGEDVSSGNYEGRLDDHSGPSTVIAHGTDGLESSVPSSSSFEDRLNSVPDGGGIEEPERRADETPGPSTVISHGTDGLESSVPSSSSFEDRLNSIPDGGGIEEPERRADETPGPSTVISHGTDGLESFFQSVMVPKLWEVVDNLGNWEGMLEEFNLESVLRNTPSYSDRLNQITNNVRSDFPRLLQLRERNPSLSLEDLKVYCVLLCWPSKKRVDFWLDLNDELLSRAKAPNPPAELKKLMLELERMWQLHFGEKWRDTIDEGWIKKFGKKWRRHFGGKWIDIIEEWWIKKFGKKWIDRIDGKWIEKIKPDYRPSKSEQTLCRGLLRFVRNRWHHPDEFMKSHGLCSVESFYNHLDERFPDFLMVSYGVAYRFWREEPWFQKYR